jgi:hypothetical protein
MVADSGIRMLLNNFYDSPPIIQAIFLPDHMPAPSSFPFDVRCWTFDVQCSFLFIPLFHAAYQENDRKRHRDSLRGVGQ